jgi:hypothetical protein
MVQFQGKMALIREFRESTRNRFPSPQTNGTSKDMGLFVKKLEFK